MSDKLRVVFEKGEALRYTGHLDILRTFVRGMRRANVPVAYSQGFSPHAVLAFMLPLGVGVTSQCEIVDVSLSQPMEPQAFLEAMNKSMPQGGIRIVSVQPAEGPMPTVRRAEYQITIVNETPITTETVQQAVDQPHLWVDKKSKRKTKRVDLKEHVSQCLVEEAEGNRVVLRVVLAAGNEFNVKPTLFVEALSAVCPHIVPRAVMSHRVRFFTD